MNFSGPTTTSCRCYSAASNKLIGVESPMLEVSTYHLAQHVKSGYEGMLIALPSAYWPR